ncbi:hypothetical protein KY316_02085, partial [Candidatus Woesearchaeota archaeon]|nr:hypothetical protein [Candidatus Woesearchaeota archaeon]
MENFMQNKAEYVVLTLSVVVFSILLVFAAKDAYTGYSIAENTTENVTECVLSGIEKAPDEAYTNDAFAEPDEDDKPDKHEDDDCYIIPDYDDNSTSDEVTAKVHESDDWYAKQQAMNKNPKYL